MNSKNGANGLQSGMSELKKITVFQIVSMAVIFIMGLIIVSSIIGSTLWLWLSLIILLAGGITLFILLVIIPTSRLEEVLRITVEQNSALKKQLANLQINLPQSEQDEIQPKDRILEGLAAELPEADKDIANAVANTPPLVCSIVQPQDDITIRETYRILVESTVSNLIAKVEIAFDSGEYIDITNQFDGTHYYYDWEIEKLKSGIHTIDARVVDNSSVPQTVDAKQIKVMIDNAVKKLRVSIKTDDEMYQLDSMLRVEVTVTDKLGDAIRKAAVDMTVYDSNNSIQAAGQGMTNANGVAYFGSEIMMDDPTGTYTIEARVSKQGYESGMESTMIEVEEAKG